jgi:hypothetical protein
MQVEPFTSGTYLFNASDPNNLTGRYGIDILGLNQQWFENRQKEIYIHPFLRQIKQYAKIQ